MTSNIMDRYSNDQISDSTTDNHKKSIASILNNNNFKSKKKRRKSIGTPGDDVKPNYDIATPKLLPRIQINETQISRSTDDTPTRSRKLSKYNNIVLRGDPE
uniref:Uncharacterized protein n=1 Tax=Parastrongyloides trichosuri TaxID=131310 RepID=A0A0N5A450_PARTI